MAVRYNDDTRVLQSVNIIAIFVVWAVGFRVNSMNADCLGFFIAKPFVPTRGLDGTYYGLPSRRIR